MISKFGCNQDGNIAIEFALLAPVLLLIVAAVVDIGSAGILSQRLNVKANAAADYILLQAAPEDKDAATTLATSLVGLLQTGGNAIAEVDINNAVAARWADESLTTSTGGGDLTRCYCPSSSQGTVAWGPPVDCDTICTAGETAGQFVNISLGTPYIPLFPAFGFWDNDTVEVSAMIRLP